MTIEEQAAVSWKNAEERLQIFTDAGNVPRLYRAIYEQCRIVLAEHARYTAGSDLDFKKAIDTLFTAEEWAELTVMKAQVQALVADWDANHGDAVGKPKATLLPIIPEES